MPIKDRWNRILRKSVSSSSSSGAGADDRTISVSNDEGDALSKPTSRLAKTLTWRSAGGSKTPKKEKAPPKEKSHPAERPLSETNMRHQELLNAFTMNFGRRKTSAGGRTSYSGISPGNSRQASVDASYLQRHPERRVSSLAGQAPREEAEPA